MLMPHGMCYLWQTDLILLHAISDLMIAVAYFGIPVGLLVLLRSITQTQTKRLIGWFIAFIVLCGATHVMEVVSIWTPLYYVSGGVKTACALVSVIAWRQVYRVALPFWYRIQTTSNHELSLLIFNALQQYRTGHH